MTTEDIYNEIIAEKENGNYPELSELNSTSKTSIWRLIIYIVSSASKTIFELFYSFKIYTEDIFAKNQHGTLLWWIEQIKAFQYGDILEFMNGIFKYPTIDETKQIVKRVALETLNYILVFKVATENSNGELIPLDAAQKDALSAYINKVKFPGTYTSVVSANADDVKLNLRVYHNAEVSITELETTIKDATDDYVKNIIFNGNFNITKLTDKLQLVRGVTDPIVKECFTKASGAPISSYIQVEDFKKAAAGYFSVLELNLEFIADV